MEEIPIITALHYQTGKPVRIKLKEGLIKEISEVSDREQVNSLYVAPGLFDNQINGYQGVDFSDPQLTDRKMRMAVDAIRKDGVTTFLPTVITNSHDNLNRIFRNLAALLTDSETKYSIPGFHLEGPYISPVEGYYGCHPPKYIRKPSWDEFMQYQEAAGGSIIQVTVSPETEDCMKFIEACTLNGIKVAIGHTNASAEQINEAVRCGARISTHLGNGCANLIDRHRNPIWPQLANDLLIPTVIADGHHLTVEELRVFYKVKGPGKLILTSDVTHLTGMKPGSYDFMGSEVILTPEGLIHNPVLSCLAGASLPLKTGVVNMMKYSGCPLFEALNMASANVASIYGLSDRGSLAPGKRADLIMFDRLADKINLREVWTKGILVYEA